MTTEEVRVEGNMAYDLGKLKVTLTPKSGGTPLIVERRFLEIWSRQPDGSWKVCRGMDNIDRRGTDASHLDFRPSSE